MNNPLVSIVIPCYNAEKYIEETIQSVLNQSETDLEIIVINDGSTDNSAQIVNAFSDKRIQLINQKNQGVSAARNLGLNKAKGTYIVFFDADDIMCDTFIEDRLKSIHGSDNIGCCSNVIFIDEEGTLINDNIAKSASEPSQIINFIPDTITCPSGYLYKSMFLKENGILFNTKLQSSADKFFLLEILEKGNIKFIEASPFYYRIINNSMSHQITKKLISDQIAYFYQVKYKFKVKYNLKPAFFSRLNYTIGVSNYHLKNYLNALYYLNKSFFLSPKTLISLVVK